MEMVENLNAFNVYFYFSELDFHQLCSRKKGDFNTNSLAHKGPNEFKPPPIGDHLQILWWPGRENSLSIFKNLVYLIHGLCGCLLMTPEENVPFSGMQRAAYLLQDGFLLRGENLPFASSFQGPHASFVHPIYQNILCEDRWAHIEWPVLPATG